MNRKRQERIKDTWKTCPRCFEKVRAEAEICKHCLSRIENVRDGYRLRVRVKMGEKYFRGYIFVGNTERMSDAINDTRHFIILTEAVEEGKLGDIAVGFLVINKDLIETIRECQNEEKKGFETRDKYEIR